MEQFNLTEWLKDKSRKVVTRNGVKAEIIHYKDPLVAIINGVAYNFDNDGKFQSNKSNHKYDLFFADEKNTNKILDELESYFEKIPKEQVEKDWKEIQDWYAQRFTEEKHNDEDELTEFEKQLGVYIYYPILSCGFNEEEKKYIKDAANTLLNLARKEIESERDRTCEEVILSQVYGEGYEQGKQDALKDLPKWKRSNSFFNTGDEFELGKTSLRRFDGYEIPYSELKKLPKEEK